MPDRIIVALLAACMTMGGGGPLLAQSIDAQVPPDREVCWQRLYDAAHLIAHPAQKVVAVRLIAAPYAFGAARGKLRSVTLSFTLRERRRGAEGGSYDYAISGLCRPAGQGLRCASEYDAGTWRIEPGPGGSLDIRNGNIVANPSNYDSEDIADDAVRIPAKPDDGVWRLAKVAGTCTPD